MSGGGAIESPSDASAESAGHLYEGRLSPPKGAVEDWEVASRPVSGNRNRDDVDRPYEVDGATLIRGRHCLSSDKIDAAHFANQSG